MVEADLDGVDDQCSEKIAEALIPLLAVLTDHPQVTTSAMMSICGTLLIEHFARIAKAGNASRDEFLASLVLIGSYVFDERHRSKQGTMQ